MKPKKVEEIKEKYSLFSSSLFLLKTANILLSFFSFLLLSLASVCEESTQHFLAGFRIDLFRIHLSASCTLNVSTFVNTHALFAKCCAFFLLFALTNFKMKPINQCSRLLFSLVDESITFSF